MARKFEMEKPLIFVNIFVLDLAFFQKVISKINSELLKFLPFKISNSGYVV